MIRISYGVRIFPDKRFPAPVHLMDVVQDDNSNDLQVKRACLGDPVAQANLLRSLQDRWFRFACTMLHDQEMARDAAQETAVRVLSRIATFDGRSRFSTWSIGITLNVCREMRRKRFGSGGSGSGRSRPGRTSMTLASVPEPAAVADDAVERQELVQRLRTAMAGLTDRQREAVLLRFFENRSVEETAELMQCAAGTVKATVHQAMAAMKTHFGVEK